MRTENFNDSSFKGFEENEHVLVDTGFLIGTFNRYDAYHGTCQNLFKKHIIGNDKTMFLYVNQTVINEVAHLMKQGKVFDNFMRAFPTSGLSKSDGDAAAHHTMTSIKDLIQHDILQVLDGKNEAALKQIELGDHGFGAADAVHLSIAHTYGTSFLTVDKVMVDNMIRHADKIGNIQTVYFTTGHHRDYR